MIVDASEAEEFSDVCSKPLRSLPYDSPGQTFVAFEKPEGLPVAGKFSNVLKFIVKEVLHPLSLGSIAVFCSRLKPWCISRRLYF